MENINSIGSDYNSYIEDIIKSKHHNNANASVISASNDILDTLLEGTFQTDSKIPENSTVSYHV